MLDLYNYQLLAVVLLRDLAKVLEHSNLHHLIPGNGPLKRPKVPKVCIYFKRQCVTVFTSKTDLTLQQEEGATCPILLQLFFTHSNFEITLDVKI